MYARFQLWRPNPVPTLYAHLSQRMHRWLVSPFLYLSFLYGTSGSCPLVNLWDVRLTPQHGDDLMTRRISSAGTAVCTISLLTEFNNCFERCNVFNNLNFYFFRDCQNFRASQMLCMCTWYMITCSGSRGLQWAWITWTY